MDDEVVSFYITDWLVLILITQQMKINNATKAFKSLQLPTLSHFLNQILV